MLAYSQLPKFLWAEAVATACYTQNRSIINSRFDKTPYEIVNQRVPNIKYFHIFGCRCFVLNDRENLGKFSAKSNEGVFIGYSQNSKAFRIYQPQTRSVIESVNVTFDEHDGQNMLFQPCPSNEKPSTVEASTSKPKPNEDFETLFDIFYEEYFSSKRADSQNVVVTGADHRVETVEQPTRTEITTISQAQTSSEDPSVSQIPVPETLECSRRMTTFDVCRDLENLHLNQLFEIPETLESQEPTAENQAQSPISANVIPLREIEDEPQSSFIDRNPAPSLETFAHNESSFVDPTYEEQRSMPLPHKKKWTHDGPKWSRHHPPEQVIGDVEAPVQTRQSTSNEELHSSFLSKLEPSTVADALEDADWIVARQEEIN